MYCCFIVLLSAIRAAVYASVRRWQFRRKFSANLGLAVEALDGPVGAGLGTPTPLVHVDLTPAVTPLLGGRTARVESVPSWGPHCRPWLMSAAIVGQWPQVRRAAIWSWVVDRRCQLCLDAEGTLEHRRNCEATRPAAGWGDQPLRVAAFCCGLSVTRQSLLRTRALLAVTLPAAPILDLPRCRWLTAEPDTTDEGLTWYTDGSVVHAMWEHFTVAACAIVVVNPDGVLVAVAEALLPTKVRTSPAAETNAIALVVGLIPTPSQDGYRLFGCC